MKLSPKKHAASLKSLDREIEALNYRRAGTSYRDIAQRMQMSLGNAHRLVQRGIKNLVAKTEDSAGNLKHVEMDRLDRMMLSIWQEALSGNMQAIDRVLRIMERRASMCGIDAPRKVAQTTPDGAEATTTASFVAIPADLSIEQWQQIFGKPAS